MFRTELNFKPKLSVLSDDQIEQIHLATLEVLERTGVQITHPRALELLDGAGARVDGNRVRLPAWIVEEAIRQAPSRVVLGQRNGDRTVLLESDKSWFGPTVDCVDYLDPFTNERRRFTSDDCRLTATVADALPNYTWVMTIGMAADSPPEIGDRVIARQVLTYCRKPMVFCSKDLASVRDIYDMAVLIAGGEDRFRRAPTIAPLTDPISPLLQYDPTIDKLLFCAEKGIPVVHLAAPQAGSTAPATFAGTVVQGTAESLSGLVLTQLVRPGAPFIFGAFTTIMDMSTTIFSYGAPEMSLMVAATVQLAHRYGLPVMGTGGCSDAKFPDPQAAAEATFSCLSSALSGANLIHEPGQLDHGSVASPAYIVLVNEVLHLVKQYMRGVPVNDETLALDVIDRVGPGQHFLQEDHTFDHFREVWYSQLFDRSINAQWVEEGAVHFEARLREQTSQAMEYRPPRLPEDISQELDRMEAHWHTVSASQSSSV
jgi:trimethylamine--corrinoid protein Co-methyltransferase